MRTAQVTTNLRCNQACSCCVARRPQDELAAIQAGAVLARIDAALAAGARELTLTGGEPTMRRDLEALVAHAAGRGAEVVLATNATLVDGPRARALRAAGLARARVNLAGWGAGLDAFTRDPGGFARTLAGLEALAAAGVPIELEAVLVRSTAPGLAALPGQARAALGAAVGGLWLAVPVASPDPAGLLSYEEVAPALHAVDAAAREVALPLKLTPGASPPPCAIPGVARLAALFAITGGTGDRRGHAPVAACQACLVADRCPGFPLPYLRRIPSPAAAPVQDPRLRRRLSLIGTAEAQIERELVSSSRRWDPIRGEHLEDVIRVIFQCNQACRFCFVSTHLPAPDEDRVRGAIEASARAGRAVALSGGEPTLHPRLAELVALASRGASLVTLQTNAIRLAEPGLAASLRAAGLQEAFVSLHGAEAAVADAVTGAPGTFERTCAGVDQLVAAGVQVRLNFVICRSNLLQLPALVRLLAARWPGVELTLSFVAGATDVVPREAELIPRYAEVLPAVEAALAEADRLGVHVAGFESMCGLPLCLVPGTPDRFAGLPPVPAGFDLGEFVDAEPCLACDLRGRCYGVRRSYVALHGAGELRPVRLEGRR